MISLSESAAYSGMYFRLFGDDLDPEEIDAILGVTATKSFKKGDVFSQGKSVRKGGMWGLELRGGSGHPSDDIKRIFEILPNHLIPISNIDGVTSGRISLWIDGGGDSTTFEIDMDLQDIELLNKLGVRFHITYFPHIEDD
jgi:Domain of unknown function (DUF4279)